MLEPLARLVGALASNAGASPYRNRDNHPWSAKSLPDTKRGSLRSSVQATSTRRTQIWSTIAFLESEASPSIFVNCEGTPFGHSACTLTAKEGTILGGSRDCR
jgi:hypothetical protein